MKDKADTPTRSFLLALEPRVMFDAALSVSMPEFKDTAETDPADPVALSGGLAHPPDPEPMAQLLATFTGPQPGAQIREVVFADSRLRDTMFSGIRLDDRVDLVFLEASDNGVHQISRHLSSYKDLEAVHIVSHGRQGELSLGSTRLNLESLDSHTSDLQSWGNALTETGDILLYGCRVAEGQHGQTFVQQIAELTHADVAGSVDVTGHTDLGGDWDLEYTLGTVETHDFTAFPNYYGILGDFVFQDSGLSINIGQTEGGALGDFDGDGDLDVFLVNTQDPDRVFFNDGSGNFTDSGQSLGNSTDFGQEVAVGDLDGDGDLDAYVVIAGSADRVYLNNGSGIFTDSGQTLSTGSARGISLGDLDGDSDLDAYVANYGDNEVYKNDGSGVFSFYDILTGSGSSQDVDLADLDSDGDLDAYVANWGSEANEIWQNDGTGSFLLLQTVGSSVSMGVSLGDVNADGHQDAFVANLDGQPDKVWLNDGSGAAVSFSDSGQNLGSSAAYGVKLADFDQDGDLDSFVIGGNYWENDGTGIFSSTTYATGGQEVLVGDVDGDADLDAFLVTRWNNRLWLNNALPTLAAGGSATYTENAAAQIVDNSITLTDDDADMVGATITISSNYIAGQDLLSFTPVGSITGTWDESTATLTLSGTDTIANYQTALRSVAFSSTSDDPDSAGGLSRTISFSADDAVSTSSAVTSTVTITPVNDIPVLTAGATTPYLENDSPTAVDGTITLTDSDNVFMTGASVTISSNYIAGQDLLDFTAMGSITGTWDTSTGTLTLTGTDSTTNYQAVLRSVVFSSSSNDPASGGGLSRTIIFSVNDGISVSLTAASTINITPVNDAPVLTSGAVTPYIENGPPTPVDSAITVTDDNISLVGAKITISANYMEGHDVLSFTPVSSITGTWDAPSATLTLSGTDTVASYQAALRSVSFSSSSDNPGAAGGLSRTIRFDVDDGSIRSAATSTVTITPVNDAPVAYPLGHEEIILKGSPAYEDGILLADILSGSTDIDGDPIGMAVVGADDTNGTWQFTLDGGVTWTAFTLVNDTSATLLAPTAATRLRFVPDASTYVGSVSLALRGWDQTQGAHGQTGVDTSVNGGTAAYSNDTALLTYHIQESVILSPETKTTETATEQRTADTYFDAAYQDPVRLDSADDTGMIADLFDTQDSGYDTFEYRTSDPDIIFEPESESQSIDPFIETLSPETQEQPLQEDSPPEQSSEEASGSDLQAETTGNQTLPDPLAADSAAEAMPGQTDSENVVTSDRPPEAPPSGFTEQLAKEAQRTNGQTIEILKLFEDVYELLQCR